MRNYPVKLNIRSLIAQIVLFFVFCGYVGIVKAQGESISVGGRVLARRAAVAEITRMLAQDDTNAVAQALSSVRREKGRLAKEDQLLDVLEILAMSSNEVSSIEALQALVSVSSPHSEHVYRKAIKSHSIHRQLFSAAGIANLPEPQRADIEAAIDTLVGIMKRTPLDQKNGQVVMAAEDRLQFLAERARLVAPRVEEVFARESEERNADAFLRRWPEFVEIISAWWRDHRAAVVDAVAGSVGVEKPVSILKTEK